MLTCTRELAQIRPLLCCLSFHGTEARDLRVAAAGFSREILVWRVGGDANGQEHPQRLRGHTGVVNCVDWREDGRALASASEDRSVKVYEQDDAGVFRKTCEVWGHSARVWCCRLGGGILATSSEDGTGRVHRLLGAGAQGDGECLAVLKGHQGKHVWRCALCVREGLDTMVITGANDSAVKVWAKGSEGAWAMIAKEATRHEISGHKLPVLSEQLVMMRQLEREREGLHQGIADGAHEHRQEQEENKKPKVMRQEHVRCCALTKGAAKTVCGTNQGAVMVLDCASGTWECAHADLGTQFTALAVHASNTYAVVGDATGALTTVSLAGAFAANKYPNAHTGHIMDVWIVDSVVQAGRTSTYSGDNSNKEGGGMVRRWHVRNSGAMLVPEMVLMCTGNCRVNCLIEVEFRSACAVLCGDRNGSITVFIVPGDAPHTASMQRVSMEDQMKDSLTHVPAVVVVKQAHSLNSVTSIVEHAASRRIYSSGRDGAINTWRLEDSLGNATGDVTMRDSDASPISDVHAGGGESQRRDRVSGVALVKEGTIKGWGGLDHLAGFAWVAGSQMIVYGFEHMFFVVWDVMARTRLVKLNCSGGKRPHDFAFLAQNMGLAGSWDSTFVFVKDSNVNVATWRRHAEGGAQRSIEDAMDEDQDQSPARDSCGESPGAGTESVWFHGREIHDVLFLPARANAQAKRDVQGQGVTGGAKLDILTASEDGTVKLVTHDCKSQACSEPDAWYEVSCRLTVEGDRHQQHGAAVRCFQWSQERDGAGLLWAGGAMDVIQCWRCAGNQRFELLSTKRNLVDDARYYMPRYMALHVAQWRDVCAENEASAHKHVVVAGMDDSFARVLVFDTRAREWKVAGGRHPVYPMLVVLTTTCHMLHVCLLGRADHARTWAGCVLAAPRHCRMPPCNMYALESLVLGRRRNVHAILITQVLNVRPPDVAIAPS
jgi:WD40 repeat protein